MMLTELYGKAGSLCGPARQGKLRCPLLVRSTSEDVITGHLVQAFRVLNPRWWLPDLLNQALGAERFRRQVYRRFRVEPWINHRRFPRELLPWTEGSTQVDIGICWENPPTTVFIEAKYQADLSASTANSAEQDEYPADQLVRNIRVGLHACGYYQKGNLFDVQPRDFVAILLTPDGRHPLVDEYRDTNCLRATIPHSERLSSLPRCPFVGQITHRQIMDILRRQSRWFNRSERVVAETLIDYLSFKRGIPGLGGQEDQHSLKWHDSRRGGS